MIVVIDSANPQRRGGPTQNLRKCEYNFGPLQPRVRLNFLVCDQINYHWPHAAVKDIRYE